MDAELTRHDPYASLRIPNFRRFILSLLTMNVATQLQAVVVSWQVYALTHDPLSLGLIGLAEALPFIGFALPAGHLADRAAPLHFQLGQVAFPPRAREERGRQCGAARRRDRRAHAMPGAPVP